MALLSQFDIELFQILHTLCIILSLEAHQGAQSHHREQTAEKDKKNRQVQHFLRIKKQIGLQGKQDPCSKGKLY